MPHYDSILCGAFAKGRRRGAAELRGDDQTGSTKTEAAFSVEPDWQNIGIGDALFERIIAIARKWGISSIELMCLRENRRMRHLAAKHNARLCIDQGVAKAVLHPNWSSPSSQAAEVVGEVRGFRLFI
ncbi:N-acetyltransferase family protein [Ruegeria faecimaris]|uniref:GNAT family N-acetyltransferase n=1 Tax=Ruegeria faecimaris TaxID=686389 RepID=UPI003CD0E263